MRFLGLIDPSSTVYQTYRVPNPQAPYPQDYIVDRQGIVRYWSDAYDPQAIIKTIDGLLATGAGEGRPDPRAATRLPLQVAPNPFSVRTTFRYALAKPGNVSLKVYNAAGDLIMTLVSGFAPAGNYSLLTTPNSLAKGSYFARLESGGQHLAVPITVLR